MNAATGYFNIYLPEKFDWVINWYGYDE